MHISIIISQQVFVNFKKSLVKEVKVKNLWSVVLIFMLAVFTVSCDKSSDPKTDVDEAAVTDTDNSENAADTDNPEADDVENKDGDVTDNENNDSVTNENEQSDEEVSECTENEMKCEGTVLKWCQNGTWKVVKDCVDDEQTCGLKDDVAQCIDAVVTCTENEKKCSGTKIQTCNSENEWIDEKDCSEDNQTCKTNEDNVACADIIALCETGTTKCSGNVVLKCNDLRQWENETVCSDDGKICEFADNAATCIVPPCTPEAKECDGDSVKTCKTDKTWETVLCDEGYTCFDDGTTVECKVKAVCLPGNTDCLGNVVMLCNAGGQWANFQTCTNSGMICDKTSGTAQCVVAPCTPAETKCDGKNVKTCNASKTWESVACVGIQMCDVVEGTAQCVNPPECSENETKCSGDVVMTCNSSLEWDSTVTCPVTGKICSAESGTAICVIPLCTPDDKKCEGTEIMLCNSEGIWTPSQDCADSSKVCNDNGTTVQCIIAPVCAPGNTQCSDALIQNCNAGGQWTTITNCANTNKTCDLVETVPTCVCIDNDLRCSGVNLEICSSGTWGIQQNCGLTGKECSEAGTDPACVTPPCTENDTMCSGDTVLACNNLGKWINQQVCTDIEKICVKTSGDAACEEPPCTPNATKCGTRTEDEHEDYIVYKCNSGGVWIENKDCLEADSENPQACKVTSGTAACINTVCGDAKWHDFIEWCDSTDPVWQQINATPGSLLCNEFWTPESGIGGTGNLKCKSNCRVDLVNCTPTGTPYGTITTVDGDITFTLDSTRLSEETYNPAGAFIFDPVFSGTMDGGSIPLDAITSEYNSAPYSYAVHVDSSNLVALIQLSLEYDPTDPDTQPRSLDQDVYLLFDDTIQTGTHSVDIYSGLEINVYGVDQTIAGTDKTCLKALGFLGHVTFSSISHLTSSDGGSFDISGGPVYLFHPTNVPLYGNLTSQLSIPICPM